MKSSEYTIKYIGLKEGTHTFDYHIGTKFFDQHENTQPVNGDFNIDLTLIKSHSMMQLDFAIDGYVILPCDLCLENVKTTIQNEGTSIIRFGDETNSFDEEIRVFGPEVFEIDLIPYFNEYIQLAIPTRIVHSDSNDCNQEVIAKLDEIRTVDDQEIDPRWDKLKDL